MMRATPYRSSPARRCAESRSSSLIGGGPFIDRRDLLPRINVITTADKVAAGVAESDQRRIDGCEIWRRRLIEQHRSEGDRKCKAFDRC